MKTKLFCLVFLIGVGSWLRADFFDMENESDRHRIAESFIDFYNRNYDYLQSHSADLKQCKNDLFQILSSNGSIFITIYRLAPKQFRENFLKLRDDIINNTGKWREQLDSKSFDLFISGVYYLQKVFF